MADVAAVIRLTTGEEITVPMGLDDLNRQLGGHDTRVAPLVKLEDTERKVHLINVSQIAHVWDAQ